MAFEKQSRLDKMILDKRRGVVELDFTVAIMEDAVEVATRTGRRQYSDSPEDIARLDDDLPAAATLRIKQLMEWV